MLRNKEKVKKKREDGEEEEEEDENENERRRKGVTRGKSPRAIFPHIIIREGLGVSMVTTHQPPSPAFLFSFSCSAPRLLIRQRTLAHVRH